MNARDRILRAVCISSLVLGIGLSLVGAEPPTKTPPPPGKGTITPSGKFVPPVPPGWTNSPPPPRTPAEAAAALQNALKVQQTGSNTFQIGRVEFDRQLRTVSVPVRVAIRSQVVEYALVTEQGKAYESLFATEASPTDVHLAFLLLGVGPVPVAGGFKQPAPLPSTNEVRIDMTWETNGQSVRVPLSELVLLVKSPAGQVPQPLPVDKWLYNGSVIDSWGFAAQREGSLISLIRDSSALVNNPGADRDNDGLHWPNVKLLPPEGTRGRLTFRLPVPPTPPARPAPPWASPITPHSTNSY